MKRERAGKSGILLLAVMLLVYGILSASAERSTAGLGFVRVPQDGDPWILLEADVGSTTSLQTAVFSGEEDILSSAVLEQDILILRLTRSLKASEHISLTVREDDGPLRTQEVTVQSGLNRKLELLEARIPRMIESIQKYSFFEMEEGKVYLPLMWTELPFALYPDEAPEICVTEGDEETEIVLSGRIPDGWHVCLCEGMPFELRECIWDVQKECFLGTGSFESVCLTRTGASDGLSIQITYSKDNDYLPQYPVLEYILDSGTETTAMNCYGWGTARDYIGGMYAIVENGVQCYAEYGLDHSLIRYYDLAHDTEYDAKDQLVSGIEEQGYVNPVIHAR